MSLTATIAALKAISSETSTAELKKVCQHVWEQLGNDTIAFPEAVKVLSDYIIKFEDAILFQKYLSNILLALVTTKIPLKPVFSSDNYRTCNDSEKLNHLEYSVVLALLSDHPDVLQYTLKYFEINSVPPCEVFVNHEESDTSYLHIAPKKRRLQSNKQKVTEHQIVECCHTLLTKLPNEMSAIWDWTTFIAHFSEHENVEIRWMIKDCMSILTNMTDKQSRQLSSNMNITDTDELKFLSRKQSKHVTSAESYVLDLDLNIASVVNIEGIMLPVFETENVQSGALVSVKSTVNNLRSLALAVASGKGLCLMGPVGSGKTSLVEHLVAITGRKGKAFKKVQLGDQTDSRMLLGTHQCTDIPGEFVWRPGVLTEAVQHGHWLLLEDIDCAALDVASTLSSLLERNTLSVPGFRDSLPVSPGFQLFVTQRTIVTNYGFQKKMSNSSALLQKHLTQINVEPLSRSELSDIVIALYPSLTTICSRMIEVFMMFSVGSHDTSLQSTEIDKAQDSPNVKFMRGSRLISTRDLMKWCSRSVIGFEVTSPDSALKVLQDALDIFTCSVASPEHRLELAKKIGTCLGIVETKTEFFCKHHKPNVALNPGTLEVGRARVLRKAKTLETVSFDANQEVFSFTRQSACLLERIACCVMSNEPVLLVGETGTGKTSSVQYLAKQIGHKLVVINMNQQSDSADLLGGFKPVDVKYVIKPIRMEFEELFKSFYNVQKNKKFLHHIETCYETENWNCLIALIKQSYKAAVSRLSQDNKSDALLVNWKSFGNKLTRLEQQIKAASRLTFAFIEGSLVKAMQEGHWVLLDEINLASAEILECLAGLLEDKDETIDLLEKGDKVPIRRHPDFTLFACMNPATDVGKKDLPVGLRNRFTEFFIDELTDRNDLMLLVGDYLYHMNLSGSLLEAIYSFYSNIKKEAQRSLIDGAGNAPHYSLRTLCRALKAAAKSKCGTVSRSLYEAFCLSFLTQLDSSSHPKVEAMITKAVIGKKNIKSVLNQLIPEPQGGDQKYLLFEGHWIPQGKLDIAIPEAYILTPTVRKNLRDIARIVSLGKLPVLLQGDTSVGKTSLITYIAKASGNYCVRINNHEHTDLQEYVGSYASDANGKLVFKEGVLVEAMRKGYWIILDELNLAPSDVLEALNRVLDDNRELFIPETQQVVRADPNFMLFATQNPPGLYGGRKMLSRAFRNRFVELHFDEIPRSELETILHQRCHVPRTYCKKMISVMADLQTRRRGSAAVQGKDGFITLRDLFRWGQRYQFISKDAVTNEKFYDWDQYLADEGYLILAGKVRQPDERHIIEEVILKHIKRKVIPENLFSFNQTTSLVTHSILERILAHNLPEFSHLVWTYNMKRLAVLIAKAFMFNEPVLLVGETGCGKTTICQFIAALNRTKLFTVNCHMHTESTDFLGGLRPVRQYNNDGRLFEWVDGPLIKAMEGGHIFLADEISLADDSVLERLNSLLEPERQLVLAERGTDSGADILVIAAQSSFHFIGTMNPGGDFGKKELSPALRNRFTEIWCDNVTSREDLLRVLERSVHDGISLGNQEDGTSGIGNCILDFTDWLRTSEVTNKYPFSIRDLLSWVHFINTTVFKGLLDPPEAYVHGACMIFLDCFGTALTGHIEPETLFMLRRTAIDFLMQQISSSDNENADRLKDLLSNKQTNFVAELDSTKFGIKPFYIDTGSDEAMDKNEHNFTFTAPTTGANTLRLLRGLQLNKAVLLEGNPGVGKTSLVTALAKASDHKVVRINLSDQTDISDLFGNDLPTEDGSFVFKEGVFLKALQNGDWILLDELNLAPQPVLEGLNACLDHRGEVYISELGKTFKVKEQTRLFACQNPLKQGGSRRGLPISFLNRFTQVYIDTLTEEDLKFIVESQYPTISKDILHRIIKFNCKVVHEITVQQSWGHRGSPWEMNLRDIQRWCDAVVNDLKTDDTISPGKFVDMLYINRMRTSEDKMKMAQMYQDCFYPEYPRSEISPQFRINESNLLLGDVNLNRCNNLKKELSRRVMENNLLILRSQLPALKALAQSVKMNWLSILVGSSATGKSSLVQLLAQLTGNELRVVPVTSAMDVSDLLGGFEQVDYNRTLQNLYDKIDAITTQTARKLWLVQQDKTKHERYNNLLGQLHKYKYMSLPDDSDIVLTGDITKFYEKVDFLLQHCKTLLNCDNKLNTHSKLRKLEKSLIALKDKVCKIDNVNVGGKFEWVDSLLVKSMVEGSWLLLDNVNLTSSAVLDRLNGLLESDGTLSIPERGELDEIVPHPDFRIFFTMDPKYGEISRAMRNRGVEIFLLRPDEWATNLAETMPHMDLFALINSCGLPTVYSGVCLEAHNLMSSFVQGMEKPTIAQLLQATYIIWQQIIRGIPYKVAIVNSFSDVYIKPRCGGDFAATVNISLAEMKNNMFNSLQKMVEEYKLLDPIDCSHTLSVASLCKNSLIETLKQISYPIIQQGLQGDFKHAYHCLFDIFLAYQKCPPKSYQIIHNILKQELAGGNNSLNTVINKLNDIAITVVNFKKDSQSFCRYFPEASKLSNEELYDTNTNYLMLYNHLINAFNSLYVQKDDFSALDYSKGVLQGSLTDDFIQYPLLKNCQKYSEAVDTYIKDILSSDGLVIDDTTTCKLIQLLNWRSRFLKICSIPMFTKTKNKRTPLLKEEIVSMLYMHHKWLQKHLIAEFHNLLPPNHKLVVQFKKNVKHLLALESNETCAMIKKISNKLRKLNGQPKLYNNECEYKLCANKANLYSKLYINFNLSPLKQLQQLSIEPARITSADLEFDVPENNAVDHLEKSVTDLFVNGEGENLPSDSNLLPIIGYVLIRVTNLIQNYFLEVVPKVQLLASHEEAQVFTYTNKFQLECNDLLTCLVESAKNAKGFRLEFTNLLELLHKLQDTSLQGSCQRTSTFAVKFWNQFYRGLLDSPARSPDLFITENKVLDDTIDYKKNSTNRPLMPYFIQKLCVTIDDDNIEASNQSLAYTSVSLQDRVEYSTHLGTTLNILWKNMAMLNLSASLKLRSDAIFEMNKYQQLICQIYISISKCDNKNHVEFSDNIFEYVVNEMQLQVDEAYLTNMIREAHEIYNKLNPITIANSMTDIEKINTKLLTSKLSLLTGLVFLKFMSIISPVDEVEKHKLKVSYIDEDIKMFDTLLSAYYIQGVVSGTITELEKCDKSSDVKPDFYEKDKPNRDNLQKVHSLCRIFMQLKEETAEKVSKYSHGSTFRPSEPSYLSFVKDCRHFSNSILSGKTMEEFYRNSLQMCEVLFNNFRQGLSDHILHKKAKTVIKENSSWLYSVDAFYKKVETQYSDALPDLAKPLLSSLSQILLSVTALNDLIAEITVKSMQKPEFSEVAVDLMVYPNEVYHNDDEKSIYLHRFVSDKMVLQFLNKNVISGNSDIEVFELLKMNLCELKMHCLSVEEIEESAMVTIVNTLNAIVKAWEKQQKQIEKKKQDDDALYVTKSKCEDIDEELEANEEIAEMFPSYSETDFVEFKPPTLEPTKYTKKCQDSESKPHLELMIKPDDVSMIYKWHSSVIKNLSCAEWLHRPKKSWLPDYVQPLLQRYPIFCRLMQNTWDALDADLEGKITPSVLLIMSNIKEVVDGDDINQKVDFYRTPWVCETKQCLPILKKVKEATNLLLDQWPDFPVLKDIILIVNRILGFPLTSAVARFLTGLELLRDKIEEWNKNAHKGNNMIDVSLAVGQQIINWRKLEMAHWKECLNSIYARKQLEAHKYWFFLYNVTKSYLYENVNEEEVEKEPQSDRVTCVLREFMEKSNLAEFEVRLDIIYTYHCHLVHLEKSAKRDELLSILWNTYNYYGQFSPQVATYIKEKRAPIEKKLKDFVKICSWDRDLSYWSVKDTVDKAHKVLHKHSKEFEKLLKESVANCLMIDHSMEVGNDHVGIWDRPKRAAAPNATTGGAYLIDLQNRVFFSKNIKKYLDQTQKLATYVPENSLLLKVPSLFNKAKVLCKDIMMYANYSHLVQALDDFVTQVIETSSHLGSLEVDASVPKEKQTSQAKNILQQKRKALADLFRYLTKMGLNYRTGLVYLSASNMNLYDFTLAPVNLDAALSYLKSKSRDATLSLLWSGCEQYFQKNIARHKFLSNALLTPHQDLGLQNIDRCRGFAAVLMKMTNMQKKSISKYSRQLCDLRNITSSLTASLDIVENVKDIHSLKDNMNILFECYANTVIVLEQFCILLKSCPEKGMPTQFEPSFDSVLSTSPIVNCYKNSEEWKKLFHKVQSILATVKKQKLALHELKKSFPNVLGKPTEIISLSQGHIDVTNEAISSIKLVSNEIDNLLQEYQLKLKASAIEDYVPEHPILRSIVSLSEYVGQTVTKLDNVSQPMDEDEVNIVEHFSKQSEDLVATMLLILQSIYKCHLPKDKQQNEDVLAAIDEIITDKENNTEVTSCEEESKEMLQENHLKELLQNKLSSDIKMLQLDSLIEKTRRLQNELVQHLQRCIDVDAVKVIAMRVVPILEQTVFIVQYFLTQQVALHRVSCKMLSVILKIFSDLTTKGFCKPADIDMDGEGEGGPGQLSSGTGLGEGEGQKDVSDKIENQDQLDDARRPGEDPKEEDRDCKEEEKGINMTDDFDSHLQDVDKKDDDESEQERDEDDADKQMGETDNAAEKLDQQIWGSEEEEMDEEQSQNDKEDKGKGEGTGEKEMAAKEEEQGQDDGTEGNEKKEKKDINEMQEPEIDDDHVDPYHGNQQPLPEPEDFELPDNMNLDGEEKDEDKEDESTEPYDPFEIMKENVPDNKDADGVEEKETENNGQPLSSDEEDNEEQEKHEEEQQEDKQEENDNAVQESEDVNEEGDEATKEEDVSNIADDKPESPEETNNDDKQLPKNADELDKEDQLNDKQELNKENNPSNNDPSQENEAENAQMEQGTNDNVQMNPDQQKDEEAAPYEQSQEQVGDEKQATGRSELDQSNKGHQGQKERANRASEAVPKRDMQKRYENKPGRTEQQRTLGEVNDRKQKKTQTLNVEEDKEAMDDGGAENNTDQKEADTYQHVKQARKDDIQAIDAATKEQADQQPTLQQDEEDAEELTPEDDIPMDVDEDNIQVEKADKELLSEKVGDDSSDQQEKSANKEGGDERTGETGVEVEGETIVTESVARGFDTTYHTRLEDGKSSAATDMSVDEYVSVREWLAAGGVARTGDGAGEGAAVWRALWHGTGGQARTLAERLRLVLEPTARSRLAGDYRTGRRINMRRVIPYVASQYRKDRIWLRRTRPARREYKVAIAIDDSSSMSDNRSKELAFESLALVSQALNLLESGDLAVLSFGEKPKLLHSFSEQFSEHSGAKILEQLLFDQTKTRIAQLLDFCTVMFEEQVVRSDAVNAKLLVVVSDGRGIFSEGEATVIHSVRRARQQGIFLVYVIIDNPDNKDSIMDIRRPYFDLSTNSLIGFISYLDTFPFPFYLILRDISALPTVLGDALRQWFELAANSTLC